MTKSFPFVALGLLLLGWMGPEYASKQGHFDALNDFLTETPALASLMIVSCWSILAVLPMPREDGKWRIQGLPELNSNVLPLATLVCVLGLVIHAAWYASYGGTNPATNTVVWNTDVISSTFIEALFALAAPSSSALCGGSLAMAGTWLSVQTSPVGNTTWGCLYCFAATSMYTLVAVIVSRYLDRQKCRVTQFLAVQGLLSLALLAVLGLTAWAMGRLPTLPGVGIVAFVGACDIFLNIGWLTAAEQIGAAQTAMAACFSIPLSMALDALLLQKFASLLEMLGGCLIILGFYVGLEDDVPESATPLLVEHEDEKDSDWQRILRLGRDILFCRFGLGRGSESADTRP
mmetsp:Transcript_21402/g.49820  ORF Transcript_21402/g.49820 Transcript_21402/m.49820 type:complete len:347 (+) Transcript_21402:46-1086(+)